MQTAKQFTTSPATSGLLIAMRHLENAQEAFYSALENIGGEKMADQGLAKYFELAEPLRAFIEAEILDNIRDWAGAAEMASEI